MEHKRGSVALTLGVIGIVGGAVWWAVQFKGDGQFITCMWWWSLKCSFASGVMLLGRGSEIQYSPLLFLAGVVSLVVGFVRAGMQGGGPELPASRPGVDGARKRELLGLPPRMEPRIVDFDLSAEKFRDINADLSPEARKVLLNAKQAGYSVRREVDREVLVLQRGAGRNHQLDSNDAVIAFGHEFLRP